MAAAFGYTKEYVKQELTLLDVYAHLTYYHENPPAGTLIKGLLKALSSEEDKLEPEAQEPQEVSDNLDDLLRDFSGAGGLVR